MNDFSFEEAFNSMFKVESNRWDYGTGIQQDYADQGKTALHYTQVSNLFHLNFVLFLLIIISCFDYRSY
jgi:hypothetical protein